MVNPGWMGMATASGDVFRSGADALARRSLSTVGSEPGGSGFRRVDVSTGLADESRLPARIASRDPGTDRSIGGQREQDRVAGRFRRQAAGQGEAGEAGQSGTSRSGDSSDPAVRQASPGVLTAGRTALLAGTLSVLAQLFGQQMATVPVSSEAGLARSEGGGNPLSPLERRIGHAVYRAVNAVVGGGGMAPFTTDGIEILSDNNVLRAPSLDMVA